jgi:hypothetical protein
MCKHHDSKSNNSSLTALSHHWDTKSYIHFFFAINFLFIGKEKKRGVVVILKVANPVEKWKSRK